MKFLIYNIFLITFLLCFSCQSTEKKEVESSEQEEKLSKFSEEENALYQDLMSTHDEIMPEMSDIMLLNKKIKAIVEDTQEPQELEKLNQLSKDLEDANEGMMVWMREFNPNLDELPEQEIVAYLKEEQKKIEKVKTNMESAIENAQLYVDSKSE